MYNWPNNRGLLDLCQFYDLRNKFWKYYSIIMYILIRHDHIINKVNTANREVPTDARYIVKKNAHTTPLGARKNPFQMREKP